MAKKDEEAEGKPVAPDDEAPPTQIDKGGKTAYSVERLMTDGAGLVGYEPHVIAGALYEVDADYLTTDEVKRHVEKWLGQKDTTQTTASPTEG